MASAIRLIFATGALALMALASVGILSLSMDRGYLFAKPNSYRVSGGTFGNESISTLWQSTMIVEPACFDLADAWVAHYKFWNQEAYDIFDRFERLIDDSTFSDLPLKVFDYAMHYNQAGVNRVYHEMALYPHKEALRCGLAYETNVPSFFTPLESSPTGIFRTIGKTEAELLALYDDAVASLNLTFSLSANGTSANPWSSTDYAIMNAIPCVHVVFGLQPNPFDGSGQYDTIDSDIVG